MVVVHHVLLVSPPLAAAYRPDPVDASGIAWWLTRTPLHLFWAGGEAVSVFFVLSGYVLWLQMRSADWRRWLVYYPARLVRLYVPVIAAVALAAILILLVARHGAGSFSWWVNWHAHAVTLGDVIFNATLANTGAMNSPLWSLKFEVIFSVLLPVYGWMVRQRVVPGWAIVLGLLGVTTLGRAVGQEFLAYLPVFGFGVLIAEHQGACRRWAEQQSGRSWGAYTVLSLGLLSFAWTPSTIGVPVMVVPSVVGSWILVLLFIYSPAVSRVGDLRGVQFLGRISFSLYLVHEPIVVTMAFVLSDVPVALVGATAIPLALAVAMVFYRLVEAPSIGAARLVGDLTRKRLESPLLGVRAIPRRHAVR